MFKRVVWSKTVVHEVTRKGHGRMMSSLEGFVPFYSVGEAGLESVRFYESCFVRWQNSVVEDALEFYELLVKQLPDGTEVYGVRGREGSERIVYVVAVWFSGKVHWSELESVLQTIKCDGRVERMAVVRFAGGSRAKVHVLATVLIWCCELRDRVLIGECFAGGQLSGCQFGKVFGVKVGERICFDGLGSKREININVCDGRFVLVQWDADKEVAGDEESKLSALTEVSCLVLQCSRI